MFLFQFNAWLKLASGMYKNSGRAALLVPSHLISMNAPTCSQGTVFVLGGPTNPSAQGTTSVDYDHFRLGMD